MMANKYQAKIAKTNQGFTLVEMLVVIAITAVLLTLLITPLVNSFRLTQRAQMIVAAQDDARITLENISRELSSASYVFSNTTHPFPVTTPSTNPNIPDLRFSNFLVLTVPKQNADGTFAPTGTPALAFNAKLDFVMPRHNSSAGTIIDPTTGGPVTITSTGTLGPAGLTFPLAPGTTMIRYWVGLRNPTKPYGTRGEGSALAGQGNNTYILFRAQFTPSNPINPRTGAPITNADGTTINENLFTSKLDASGNPTNAPEFDDPDFFRYVTTSDINWLSVDHHNYTSAEVTAHNARVDKWFQIAKPVINVEQADLILLPHNPDNSLQYDQSGPFQGIAHSGAMHDPVSNVNLPVVNTSVTFSPASVSADASAATANNNVQAGYGGDVTASNNGLPYIPTAYTASDQSWAFPYQISLFQAGNTTYAAYQTVMASNMQSFANSSVMYAGDLIEQMYNPSSGSNGAAYTPVYDITNGEPLVTTGTYVPMTVMPDTGTINFDMPALPVPANPYQRFWSIPAASFATVNGVSGPLATGIVNLGDPNFLPNTPLPPLLTDASGNTITPSPRAVENARIVPGTLRVYGPDATPGSNQGLSVLYTEVSPGDASFGPNDYQVDYTTNTLTFYVDPGTHQMPVDANGQSAPVQIAFDYQANLSPDYTGSPASLYSAISATNPAAPLEVKVDYQTRDLLDINLGVRLYDPNNVGPAQLVTVHGQVRIGNSNR